MAELFLLVLIGASAVGAAAAFRANSGREAQRDWVHLELWFPRDLTADATTSFLRSLSTLRRVAGPRSAMLAAVIEVTADTEGIRHRVDVARVDHEHVLSQLRAAVPGVRIDVLESRPALAVRLATELRLDGTNAPLATDPPESIARALLASLQAKDSEQIVVQWLVAATVRTLPTDLTNLSADARRALRRKLGDPAFLATVRIGVGAASDQRARQLLRQVAAMFGLVRAPGTAFRPRRLPAWWIARQLQLRRAPLVFPVHVNARELAALVGFPLGGPQIPGLRLGAARHLAASRDIPAKGKVLAQSNFPGVSRDIAVSVPNSLRHIHLIGPTSSGKSTTMMNLAVADAAEGRGLAMFDPSGDLVTDFLDRLPAKRLDDVVLVDLKDRERPVGFNLLAGGKEMPELVTDQIVSVIRRVWASSWGPRLEDLLRGSLLTLAQEPGMTLTEVPLLLGDENFRRRLVGKLDDPIVLEPLWSWFDTVTPAERSSITGPVHNKIRSFTARRPLRNVIGQSQSSFTMEEVLDRKRILLVSVAKGLVGEDSASLFGSLLLARLWQAAMGRAALPAHKREPFACYIDECQDFLNLPSSLADVLAQARKYGLGIVAAHQHLTQLPPELRQALLANARSRVVWQPSATDARVMAREFAPHLTADDLKGLGPFEVAVQVCTGPSVATPATGRALPPVAVTGQGDAARAASRERYGRPVELVEREIRARHGDRPGPGSVGRRKRS